MPRRDTKTCSQNPEEIRSDVTAAVDELLNKLSNQFAEVSQEMFAKSERTFTLYPSLILTPDLQWIK